MKREIKFRAWDKLNKEMTLFGLFERPTACYGKEVEIMQFTGLLDKQGKEIYEGDIIQKGTKSPRMKHQIIYHRDGWFGKNNRSGQYKRLSSLYPLECEIIGNVWENPELLSPTSISRD